MGDEAFEVAQGASQSSSAAALQQMANRFAAGDGSLASLIRLESGPADAAARHREGDPLDHVDARRPKGAPEIRSHAQEGRLRSSPTSRPTSRSSFPDYAALTSPKPLEVAEAQKLWPPTRRWSSSRPAIPNPTSLRSRARALTGRRSRSTPRRWPARSPPFAAVSMSRITRSAGSQARADVVRPRRRARALSRADRAGRGPDQGQASPAVRARRARSPRCRSTCSSPRSRRRCRPPARRSRPRPSRPIAMPPGCSSATPSPCCRRSRASRRCACSRARIRPASR